MVKIVAASSEHLHSVLVFTRDEIGSDKQAPWLKRAFERAEILVAVDNERVLGYIIWNREFFEQAFIWLLRVQAKNRRQGIARALIAEIERRVGSSRKLFTSTNESNPVAQRTFEALGFVRSGRIENLDPGDPELIYFKQL